MLQRTYYSKVGSKTVEKITRRKALHTNGFRSPVECAGHVATIARQRYVVTSEALLIRKIIV